MIVWIEDDLVLLSRGSGGGFMSARGVAGCLVLVLATLLVAAPLRADGRTQFLIDRLKYPPGPGLSDDPRVRTSTALALGASNDDAAVQPRCDALGDPSDLVRASSPAAMKRPNKPAALPCLQSHIGSES